MSLTAYDEWKTRVPEHEDAEDYADTVKRICDEDADRIDQVLELLADLDRRHGESTGDFRDAADCVVDMVRAWVPGFKRTDRVVELLKR